MFITMALSISVMDISKLEDSNGDVIEPDINYTHGAFRYALFLCRPVILTTNIFRVQS